jgi:hypothetical protein
VSTLLPVGTVNCVQALKARDGGWGTAAAKKKSFNTAHNPSNSGGGGDSASLATVLAEHGLADYHDLLEPTGVGTNALDVPLSEDALAALGVTRKIHRRRIIAALTTLPATVTAGVMGEDERTLVPFATLCHTQFWPSPGPSGSD